MKYNVKGLLISFVILNAFSIFTKSEYSSALVDLEPLIDTQGEVVKTLEEYLELEEERLDKVRRFAEEYDKLHKSAIKNVDNFLSNPVNAYILVKRLTSDWNYVLDLVEETTNEDIVYDLTEQEIFPNTDDLEEAANALIRLQDTYLLDTAELSKGEVAGMKGVTELTASDCFELGMGAYYENDFNRSVTWFQEALNRLDMDEYDIVNKSSLLDHMSFATYGLGNVQQALELTLELIETDPYHPFARQNLESYANVLRDKADASQKLDINRNHLKEASTGNKIKEIPKEVNPKDPTLIDVERYKKLCRGEHLRSPAQESKLSCRYTTSNSKYLLFQPAKEETLNLDPWIVVYHDVIRDRDIELLKEIAEPLMGRATVLNPVTGSLDFAKYRVSKSGWLPDDAHPRISHISLLIKEITGLETYTAECLQINKYGLGGHYEGHYDFRRPGEFDGFAKFGTGNRIATWLFYLSDVYAGGSTVFPDLDVQVKPIKGSAGFWFNLFKSGRGDLRTKHAACPVLAGTKWVANKWLHEKDQEFRRPCSLNPFE